MKRLLLPVLALFSFAVAPALRADDSAAYQVSVPAMKCGGCAFSISEELKKLDAVSEVYVDPKTKVALVSAKTAEGPGEESVMAAVKAAGYQGNGYKKLTTTFAEAKAALTGGKG